MSVGSRGNTAAGFPNAGLACDSRQCINERPDPLICSDGRGWAQRAGPWVGPKRLMPERVKPQKPLAAVVSPLGAVGGKPTREPKRARARGAAAPIRTCWPTRRAFQPKPRNCRPAANGCTRSCTTASELSLARTTNRCGALNPHWQRSIPYDDADCK